MSSTIDEYNRRKKRIIEFLGGKCKNCGLTNNLHIDHIDHNKKNFTISNNWGRAWHVLEKELILCQLLCETCHLNKTLSEGSLTKAWTTKPRGITHGTIWGYSRYKCRCEACRKAKSEAEKKYYWKKKLAVAQPV